ncbi:hypothetical protein ASD99_00995 [Mesorhizobium sp. Root695]|uniref:hypothetical protein n=1 Tax=Mesorhizobium sp. Root695 TaxID=1736589 RepID=UPI0007098188|nr:hypothetical protein [Mesorhizobium sp. Root695]KRB34241.1 hypothetical protein ASD99_00995 [Mesorhizobium sp. Root695]
MLSRIPQSEFLGPEELAICQCVFDQLCIESQLERGSVDGEALAFIVLSVFQRGTVKEADLLAEMQARRKNDLERHKS